MVEFSNTFRRPNDLPTLRDFLLYPSGAMVQGTSVYRPIQMSILVAWAKYHLFPVSTRNPNLGCLHGCNLP